MKDVATDGTDAATLSDRLDRTLAPGDQVAPERHFSQLKLPARRDSLIRVVQKLSHKVARGTAAPGA
jgi:hypothetical protein